MISTCHQTVSRRSAAWCAGVTVTKIYSLRYQFVQIWRWNKFWGVIYRKISPSFKGLLKFVKIKMFLPIFFSLSFGILCKPSHIICIYDKDVWTVFIFSLVLWLSAYGILSASTCHWPTAWFLSISFFFKIKNCSSENQNYAGFKKEYFKYAWKIKIAIFVPDRTIEIFCIWYLYKK